MTNIADGQTKIVTQLEDMITDSFNRMKLSCIHKCLKLSSDDADVVKPEAVCMDRCVAKYLQIHELLGKQVGRDKKTFELLSKAPYLNEEKLET